MRKWIFPVVLAVSLAVAAGAVWWTSRPSPQPVRKFSISIGDDSIRYWANREIAISPDGTKIAYTGRGEPFSQLYLRPIDRLEPAPIPGTSGARGPFFTHDGEWIVFDQDDQLKKVSVRGGE